VPVYKILDMAEPPQPVDNPLLCTYFLPVIDPTNHTLSDLIADLDASDADIEAGRIIPGETLLAELEARLRQLEARLQQSGSPRAISQ
jgi:hypothetical protein